MNQKRQTRKDNRIQEGSNKQFYEFISCWFDAKISGYQHKNIYRRNTKTIEQATP
jgi:hypothetical protein